MIYEASTSPENHHLVTTFDTHANSGTPPGKCYLFTFSINMFVYKNCLHFFSEHSPTNSETNDITLTEEELLLKRFEHNEGIFSGNHFHENFHEIDFTEKI